MAAIVVESRGMSEEHAQFSVHNEPAWRERANFIVNAVLPEPVG
ncbi:hypothetical protein Cde04nite_11740 [Cellulomonas denverensis]|nr:hypothetical protein Cde04nite_11740 [Cellulomonas denverensis]